eukprot:TRINITY_DN2067_c0_g6_i1.p2 TRINITY_DN2067_c0_g6~~TRINITY_DN2067_c0_g6_i1.p2  ORF type:complete len:539 (+),score=189.91 TRINITY_DN2067_c0_g6_i1:99-1715(+)
MAGAALLVAGVAAATPLNVLFFAVDDLRPELSPYGSDPIPGTAAPPMHTPNFERLAQRSLLAKRNYCQQAVCSPTRTSLLTGRRPDRTRTYDLWSYFRNVAANYTTIPQYFKQQGYYTVGMGKIFHPGHASGQDDACCSWTEGVEYFHAPNLQEWSSKERSAYNSGRAWYAATPEEEATHALPDNQTAEHAVGVLKKLPGVLQKGQPFFVAVGFHKPHLPFVFPEAMLQHYPQSAVSMPTNDQPPLHMPAVAWSTYGELRAYADQAALHASGNPGTVLPADDVLALRRAYYSAVSATDHYLGVVLDALDASPYAKNTIVSIWGDHGWQLGEHGEWCKHTNFEFAARAPMMVSVPGLTDKGIVTEHYTSHADLFPTLVQAALGHELQRCPDGDASFNVSACTEGYSLLPLMRGEPTPAPNHAFSQYPRGYHGAPEEFGDAGDLEAAESACIIPGKKCTMGYSVVGTFDVRPGEHFRYTVWCDFNTKYPFKADMDNCPFSELYNHTADPGENVNIAGYARAKEVEAALRPLLVRYAAGKW